MTRLKTDIQLLHCFTLKDLLTVEKVQNGSVGGRVGSGTEELWRDSTHTVTLLGPVSLKKDTVIIVVSQSTFFFWQQIWKKTPVPKHIQTIEYTSKSSKYHCKLQEVYQYIAFASAALFVHSTFRDRSHVNTYLHQNRHKIKNQTKQSLKKIPSVSFQTQMSFHTHALGPFFFPSLHHVKLITHDVNWNLRVLRA